MFPCDRAVHMNSLCVRMTSYMFQSDINSQEMMTVLSLRGFVCNKLPSNSLSFAYHSKYVWLFCFTPCCTFSPKFCLNLNYLLQLNLKYQLILRIYWWLFSFQDMGTSLRARARIQINLAVSQVIDIKQVANFPDIIFPILWFEEGIDGLPDEITDLMNVAATVPPKARIVLMIIFFALGGLLFVIAVFCLIRRSHRQSTLHLEGSNYLATAQIDLAKKKAKENKK